MDLEGRGGSEELEGVEGGEIMIELYCMRRESIFSKRGGETLAALTEEQDLILSTHMVVQKHL